MSDNANLIILTILPFNTNLIILSILPLVVALIGLATAVLCDQFIKREQKRVLLIVVVLLFSLVAQNYVEYRLMLLDRASYWRTIVSIFGYSARPFVIILFLRLVRKRDAFFFAALGLCVLNTLIYLTATFSGIVFFITESNHFMRGPLGYTCHIVSGILLAYLFYLSVRECFRVRKVETVIPLLNVIVVVATIFLDSFVLSGDIPVSTLTESMVICSVFYYVWLHLRFVRDHEEALVEENRNRIILSQIQPHFIYNTLFSIQNIEGNPEETKRAITEFSNYIRGNLSALDGKELIPFRTEMDNVRDYISLQQRRFPGKFNVVYEIEDTDFSIPPLTIQILVENAIKHGISVRYESGTIKIRSYRRRKDHIVEVIDDGVGFDTEKLKNTARVGIRAAMNRLKYHLNATIAFESEVGKGTRVTIKIPCFPEKEQGESEGKNENTDR